MDLLRRFSDQQFEQALESWDWIPELSGKKATVASPFGDIFLQSADGAYWVLDLLEGSLNRCAASASDLQALLDTVEGQDELLLAALAEAAWRAGHVPGPDQVLTFSVPPIIGGALEVANIEVMDFVVAVNIAGQILRQVQDLPPGTTISGFTIDGDVPE